jgi:hypothetical protein
MRMDVARPDEREMTRLERRSTAAIILALSLSPIASAADKFDAYMNAALQNAKSEPGKRYSPAFQKEYFAGPIALRSSRRRPPSPVLHLPDTGCSLG